MKNRIRELRKSKGWTLDNLADVTGTSKGHLSDIETDKREPSTKMLTSISIALGVGEFELLVTESSADHGLIQMMKDYSRLSVDDRLAVSRHAQSLLSRDDT